MPLISCKVESKLTWKKYCVLSVVGNNDNDQSTNISFCYKDTKLYVPIVTLSDKDNLKVSNNVYLNEDGNVKNVKSKDIYKKVLLKTTTY